MSKSIRIGLSRKFWPGKNWSPGPKFHGIMVPRTNFPVTGLLDSADDEYGRSYPRLYHNISSQNIVNGCDTGTSVTSLIQGLWGVFRAFALSLILRPRISLDRSKSNHSKDTALFAGCT